MLPSGRRHPDGVERARIVRQLRRNDAFHAEARIGNGVAERAVDTEIGEAGGAVEIDVDGPVGDRQPGHQFDLAVEAVDGHGVGPASLRQGADRIGHSPAAAVDDEVGKRREVLQAVFVHHRQQPFAAGVVAGGERVEVADHHARLAHIGPHHLQKPFVDPPRLGERHERHEQALLIDLPGIGSLAEAADIDHMAGGGEQRHDAPVAEGRRHDREVVQVARAFPGIVGDENIALAHGLRGKFLDEMADRERHRVDMAGRAGHRLGKHPPGEVEDARRYVAGLARRGRKRRPHQRLRLLLHHRKQPVPHHLMAHGIECSGHAVPLRVSTRAPEAATVRSKPSGATVAVSSSTTTAGPASRTPGASSARACTAASIGPPDSVS